MGECFGSPPFFYPNVNFFKKNCCFYLLFFLKELYNYSVRKTKKNMEKIMKANFNNYASKIMECEKMEDIVSQLYWCYYKYNGWEYAAGYDEIIDALDFENKERLAEKIEQSWDLDEETQLNILYYITVSEIATKYLK